MKNRQLFQTASRRTFLLIMFCWMQLYGMAIFAQTKIVTGQVIDVTNSPLPGVNILVKGTTIGCITDIDGNLPYLPVAELASNNGHVQSLTMSRIQRSYITEYIFSLKDWVDKLAQREAVLSLHREKLYDATAYYRCQPVCEYYIFTLRRILI